MRASLGLSCMAVTVVALVLCHCTEAGPMVEHNSSGLQARRQDAIKAASSNAPEWVTARTNLTIAASKIAAVSDPATRRALQAQQECIQALQAEVAILRRVTGVVPAGKRDAP